MRLRTVRIALAAMLLLLPASARAQQPAAFSRLVSRTAPAAPRDVIRQQAIEIPDAGLIADASRSSVLQLDLFADVTFRAVRDRIEPTANGVSWSGTLEGYPGSSAVFVLANQIFLGHIWAPFGFFRIEQMPGGGYVVQQVDQHLSPEPYDDGLVPPRSGAQPRAAAAPPVAGADSGSQIDVLVVYTTDARAAWGGTAQAAATIDLLISETNSALRNTGVNTSLRLMHSREVSYTETGNSLTDLNRVRITNDGYLDDVAKLRDQYAADLVVLIVQSMTDACGRAWVTVVDQFRFSDYAYAVVARGCTNNGRTFAHEVGHNMGAQHDWYVSAKDGSAFPYSYGYTSQQGRFMDIMSYADMCRALNLTCAQLNQYSNPRLQSDGFRTGVPSGTSQSCVKGVVPATDCDADLGTSFNNVLPILAGYRDSASIVIRDRLASGAQLQRDQILRSSNARYRLILQGDGNLVLYDEQTNLPLWATNTSAGSAATLVMQTDGNLVLYDGSGVPRFASNTSATANRGASLLLQNDGNLVLYAADGRPIWDRYR